MKLSVLGIYREPEFSPGKVADDAAIMNAVAEELGADGFAVSLTDAAGFCAMAGRDFELVLAMCQGQRALARLGAWAESGVVIVNSALAIRNCYRDLLGAGLKRAGVPTPEAVLLETSAHATQHRLGGVDPSAGVFVKRGDLHALGAGDVRRACGIEQVREALFSFACRGIKFAYVQQEAQGSLVKFYGVGGGEYFAALGDGFEPPPAARRELARAAGRAAQALGLEVFGGDAMISGEQFRIIDFNDWPSFSSVRAEGAAAIARRCRRLVAAARHAG